MELLCLYWGGDQGGRGFDVVVDDQVIATESAFDKPGEFVRRIYSLPSTLTAGRTAIRVKFQSHRGKLTASVFECRTVKATKSDP